VPLFPDAEQSPAPLVITAAHWADLMAGAGREISEKEIKQLLLDLKRAARMHSFNNFQMRITAEAALQFDRRGRKNSNERPRFLDSLNTIASTAITVRDRIIAAVELAEKRDV
jgi:hypothetical protein